MKSQLFRTLLFLFLIFQGFLFSQKKEIVAYYPEWGIEHQPYYVRNIEKNGAADKITTLIYAFCTPAPDSLGNIVPNFMKAFSAYQQVYNSEMSIDGIADDSTQPLRGQFNQLRKLKARHPQIMILISIGGWTGSKYLSDAALTVESREKFTDAVIDMYIKGDLPVEQNAGGKAAAAGIFDGIDFDWEYPLNNGNEGIHHNQKDNDNLSELYALFRKKLDSIDPKLLLTAAVPAIKNLAQNYNINKDQGYLNWYNIMTYDFRGGWSAETGHHTNLLSSYVDSVQGGMKESFDGAVRFFRDSLRVKSDKIVPGAAFYGRGWITQDTINLGLYRPGKPAPGIYEEGFNYYSDLEPLRSKDYNFYWDNIAMAPFIYSSTDRIFWTLDNEKSIALKSLYGDAYNLKGIMFWEVSGDDSAGSLINAIYNRAMPDGKSIGKIDKRNKKLSITKPLSKEKYLKGSNIIISTNTEYAFSHIVKVEFFADGSLIGYDTNPPFSWVWFNVPEGQHKLKITATDVAGKRYESAPVVISIQPHSF